MEDLQFKELQQCAIRNVMARIDDAHKATTAIRIGELNALHIAAYMDIDKTVDSLKHILEYKKEVAKKMLRCSDEQEMKIIAEVIKHADDLINKTLGIYVP